jgi:chorismate mutase / prephenate dehydratase
MSEDLQRLRDEIDALDEEILRCVVRRAQLAQDVGRHKTGGEIYRPEREAQVLTRLLKFEHVPVPDASLAVIFREIVSTCRALEAVPKVAYLGPEGTFSQAAVIKHFGHAVEGVQSSSMDDVFRAVESGNANFGIVPVENSTEGAVGRTLDLALDSPLKVCGEVLLDIHQCLMRRVAGMEGIELVYSHAQSLGQCHEWLNRKLPHVERVRVASNAEGARLAAADSRIAAIAGEIAAERYELEILARNIEDDPDNTTRFLVIGSATVASSGRDKTSLALAARNRPGAMAALLEPLARHGVSMTRFESRPSRRGNWEYVFYVDIEGHADDAEVKAALDEIDERASFMKILGSYPAAVI